MKKDVSKQQRAILCNLKGLNKQNFFSCHMHLKQKPYMYNKQLINLQYALFINGGHTVET